MAVVGVIPAAGFGMRLGPLRGSKEVVLIGGRPVIEYLVERLRLAPCSELRVVTRPDKRDVIEHARRLGASVLVGRPASVAESLLLGLEGLDPEDVVLLGFPDTLWEPRDGFATLLAALRSEVDAVLGCFHSAEPERSDVVVLGAHGRVRAVQVKPTRPASHLVWGCCAARARTLAALRGHDEPGSLLDRLAATGVVRAVVFPGQFVDIGTRESLERALADAAKTR